MHESEFLLLLQSVEGIIEFARKLLSDSLGLAKQLVELKLLVLGVSESAFFGDKARAEEDTAATHLAEFVHHALCAFPENRLAIGHAVCAVCLHRLDCRPVVILGRPFVSIFDVPICRYDPLGCKNSLAMKINF